MDDLVARFAAGEILYHLMDQVPIDDAATIDALERGLACRNWRGALACVTALGRAETERSRAAALAASVLSADERSLRRAGAEALARLGPIAAPHGERALCELVLRDEDLHVVKEGLAALGHLAPGGAGNGAAILGALLTHAAHVEKDLEALRRLREARGAPAGPPPAAHLTGHRPFQERYELVSTALAALGRAEVDAGLLPSLLALARTNHFAVCKEAQHVLLRLAGCAASDDAVGHAMLALLGDDLATMRAFAARALGEAPRMAEGAVAALSRALADPDEAVACASATALGAIGGPAAVGALERAVGDVSHGSKREGALRAALSRLEVGWSLGVGEAYLASVILRAVPLPRPTTPALMVRDGTLMVAARTASSTEPDDRWQMPREELGIVLTPVAGDAPSRYVPLPVLLPPKRVVSTTPARSFRLAAELPEGPVFVLTEPFEDARGWGHQSWIYLFDLETELWCRLEPRGAEWHRSPLAAPMEQSPRHAVCNGGLLLWQEGPSGRLHWHSDKTPYHLDDWSSDPDTSRALQAERAHLARMNARLRRVDDSVPETWKVETWPTLVHPGGVLKEHPIAPGATRLSPLAAIEATTEGGATTRALLVRAQGGPSPRDAWLILRAPI